MSSLDQGIINEKKFTNVIKTKGPTKFSDLTYNTKNMVLSALSLDQNKVVIQQSLQGSRLIQQQQQSTGNNQQNHSQQSQQLSSGNIINLAQLHRGSPNKIITAIGSQNQLNMSGGHTISAASMIHSHIQQQQQQQQQQHQQQQNHHISQSVTTSSNNHHTISKIVGTNNITQSPSKYVFLQQNGNGLHYASNEAFLTTDSSQPNGVGNIVIVATEPMDLNNPDNLSGPIIHTANGPIIHARAANLTGNGDESDLTSLTWLQDKNLIKGIVTRGGNNPNKSLQNINQSPNRLPNNREISPSIEYIEEQTINNGDIIETNMEPSKQHQLNYSIANNELSYEKVLSNQATNNKVLPQQLTFTTTTPNSRQPQQQQQQNHIITSTNNNINRLNKNHIVTTSGSPTSYSSTVNDSLGATTTVHVGPSGTTTVVEYKTNKQNNNVPINSRHFSGNEITASTILNMNQNTMVPIKNQQFNNFSGPNNVVVTSNINQNETFNTNSSSKFISSNQQHAVSSSTSTTTHHPHKKYLREQMNGSNMNGNSSTSSPVNSSPDLIINANINDVENTEEVVTSNNIPINYSGDGKISSSTIKFNSSLNDVHQEIVTSYAIDNSSAGGINKNGIKNSPHQIIYKEYEIESPKEMNKKGLTTPIKGSPNINKDQISNITSALSPSKQKHPNNVPYDPKTHANAKPPYSFSSLIFMAIEDSPEKALPVKEIYAWIVQHFPYFKTAPTGWKNSVRHNLSLNKSFLKVEKAPNMGKGSLWRVEQHQRPNLIQALTRSPFYPCPAVDKLSPQKSPNNQKIISTQEIIGENLIIDGGNGNGFGGVGTIGSPPNTPVKSSLDAKLFPKLSKLMKEMGNLRTDLSPQTENGIEIDSLEQSECQSEVSSYSHNVSSNNSSNDGFFPQNGNSTPSYCATATTTATTGNNNIEKLARDCGADSIDDVNAATAMLALKHGSKIFNENYNNGTPVITNSPSADHTYSAGNGSNSSNTSVANSTCNTNGYDSTTNRNSIDNISTCASSDAAYESSDESRNLTPDELEYKRRVEGVDALLSLSSACSQTTTISSNKSTPCNLKRPATEFIEEPVSYMENIPHLNGKGVLGINSSVSSVDEGYNTQGYYNQLITLPSSSSTPTSISTTPFNLYTTSSPSLPKKLKASRLRAKIKQFKRKTASLR